MRLRGPALGGWLFHENWITAVDYPASSRLYVLGQEAGLEAEVRAALLVVGPSEKADDVWLAAFRDALVAEAGATGADALLATFADYPSVVDDSDRRLRLLLESRFGVEGRDALLDTFEAAWVTRADVEWIADQGFDMVRIPMGYRALTAMSDTDTPTGLVWNEAAFARLDDVLGWCRELGIYAVLDIQEAPGGQNEYAGPSTLYTDPAMQDLTVGLWEELSRRYAGHDEVGAYSLLAEPMSAPTTDDRDRLYDRLVQAIRAQGDDHLCVIHDGFEGMYTLPQPESYGWTNVVYSTHLFEWDAASLDDYLARADYFGDLLSGSQETQQVPYYIGSFSTFVDADWAYSGAGVFASRFEDEGWGWTVWTYKRIDDPIEVDIWGNTTSWGVRGRLQGTLDRPDLYRDEEAELERKFAAYADLEVAPNEDLLGALLGAFE